MQDSSAANNEVTSYLQYLAATLLSRAGALKLTSTAQHPPLQHDDIVVVSALAFPSIIPWSDEPVRAFLDADPAMCRRMVTFAVENHIRVQSFIKAGESFIVRRHGANAAGARSSASKRGLLVGDEGAANSKQEAPPATPLEQAVESVLLVAKFLCRRATAFDALIVDIDDDDGDEAFFNRPASGAPTTALRMELHRALSNFLLRHMFFRMAPNAKELRRLPKPLYTHVELLPAWPVSPTFTPGALPPLPHELLHDIKASEDPMVHALMNVFGYAPRRAVETSSLSRSPAARNGSPRTATATASRPRSSSRLSSPGLARGTTDDDQRGSSSRCSPSADFTRDVSLSKIPYEQSVAFFRPAACGGNSSNLATVADQRHEGGGELFFDPLEGDDGEGFVDYNDGPPLDGGLPWLQLMDDLAIIAPFVGTKNSLSVSVKEPPVALRFATLSPAEAVGAQFAGGGPTAQEVLLRGRNGATAGKRKTNNVHHISAQQVVMKAVMHYGSSLLSVGLDRILLAVSKGPTPSPPADPPHLDRDAPLSCSPLRRRGWKQPLSASSPAVPLRASSSSPRGSRNNLSCPAAPSQPRTYPVSAEYVGEEFRLARREANEDTAVNSNNPLLLSPATVDEHFAAFGIVREQSLRDAILVSAHNVTGLANAACHQVPSVNAEDQLLLRRSLIHGRGGGGGDDGRTSGTVKALEATKQLLVSLAEQVYSRIANSLTAPTTSAGAAGGSEAAAQVKDALAAQQLMSRNGDVLDALCQCGTQLRAAGARNAPFLLTLCRDLKATAELGGGGGAVPSAGGLAAKQIDAGRSVRQRETVGAGTAVKAVHALIACGARARRSVAFQIDASGAEPKRAAKQVPQVGDGLRLILHHPSSAAASRSHASHLNSSFDPEQSRRSADRGFGLDDYSDEESGHDDTEGGEAAMVVSLDELVSDLHRQMKWLKSREVDFEAVESALRDLSSLRNG